MTIHHDIDNVFKKGLEDYSAKPPGFVWDNIQQQLDNKKSKRRKSLLYSMAATVALLLSFGAGYIFHFFTPINNGELANLSNKKEQVINELPKEKTHIVVIEDKPQNNTEITEESYSKESKVVKSYNNSEVGIEEKGISSKEQEETEIAEEVASSLEQEEDEKPLVKKSASSGMLLAPSFASGGNANGDTPIGNTNNSVSETLVDTEVSGDTEEEPNGTPFSEEYNNKKKTTGSVEVVEPISSDEKENVWGIGVAATPLLSYRNIKTAPETNSQISSVDNYDNERPLVAYAAGVDVNYKVADRWKVHSGVYVSKVGQVSENINMDANQMYASQQGINSGYNVQTSTGKVNVGNVGESYTIVLENAVNRPMFVPSSGGEAPPPPSVSADMVQTFSYLEIPLVVSYKVVDRKFGVDLSGGLSTNLMYGNNIYLESNGDKYSIDSDVDGVNKVNYNGVIGVGFNYPIVEKLKVNIQPTFRYSLTPINSEGSVYPYSFGVFSGVQYQF